MKGYILLNEVIYPKDKEVLFPVLVNINHIVCVSANTVFLSKANENEVNHLRVKECFDTILSKINEAVN